MRRLILELSERNSISISVAIFWQVLCLLLCVVSASEARQAEIDVLRQGQVIERELAGGVSHAYRIALASGQYLKAVIEQKGVDVVVRIVGPGGQKLAEVDDVSVAGLESAFVVAEVSGDYRLEVRPVNKEAKSGGYAIKIDELREATPEDRTRMAAQKAFEEANQLRDQGTAVSRRRAGEKYRESLPVWRAFGERAREALTLNEIGFIHSSLGETREALEYYGQAQALFHLLGDRVQEAGTLNNLGMVYSRLGESQKALEYLGQSLHLKRAMGDRRGEANTLGNIGLAYFQMGELQEALGNHLQALSLKRSIGDKRGESVTLINIGVVYSNLGEEQKALEYYEQALTSRRSLKDRAGEAVTLYNIGVEYLLSGELKKALDYFDQSLPIRREVGDRMGEAYTLSATGLAYARLGEPQKALGYYEQALSLSRAVGDRIGEATTLNRIGMASAASNNHDAALDYFTQALRLNQDVGSRAGEVTALYNIARAERDLGHLAAAQARVEAALDMIESIRGKIAGQALRASYLASKQNFYEFYTDLLMQIHKAEPTAGADAKALQANERKRARGLLEILAEARADIRQGVDAALLERERRLRQQLSVKSERLTRLLGGKHTEEEAAAGRKEVEALLADYEEVEAQVRAKSPRYAMLTQPQPLSLKEIQQVLDPDTLLLEYALGEVRSYLWAVTTTSITSYELPKRAEIEDAARHIYDLFTARNRAVKFEEAKERRSRIAKADAEYSQAAGALSRILLGAVVNQIQGKRLLIVGDGALQYLPFAALPLPDPSGQRSQRSTYVPLIAKHEVVTLPSASTLAVLRKEVVGRKPAPKLVAVLADPVFDNNDERVKATGYNSSTRQQASIPDKTQGQSVVMESELTRSVRDLASDNGESLFPLSRLPFTRREAEAIVAFPPAKQHRKVTDFAANRAAALNPGLSQYRYVHFATHGILNSKHPELSGIVLSLITEDGKDQDGFLVANDVYNMNLPAELVVLSGCRTGLGKEIKGEGLLSLTRGFMYAGATRVLVSLWDVNDNSTAELMAQFYKGMLGKQRLSPAAALRQAQISLWRSANWHAPYYWAAFVLQGEYR